MAVFYPEGYHILVRSWGWDSTLPCIDYIKKVIEIELIMLMPIWEWIMIRILHHKRLTWIYSDPLKGVS